MRKLDRPELAKIASIVIDVDDVGEDGLRRQRIEDVMDGLERESSTAFVYKFSVEERGWNIWFVLDVEPTHCRLRLADRYDYDDNRHSPKVTRAEMGQRCAGHMTVTLHPLGVMTTEELLNGVETFLVADVMGT